MEVIRAIKPGMPGSHCFHFTKLDAQFQAAPIRGNTDCIRKGRVASSRKSNRAM
jgi:hypothetical protein